MQWVVKGNLRGPKGEDGKGIKIVGNIDKWEDLPTDYTGIEEGDSYYNPCVRLHPNVDSGGDISKLLL